MKRSDEVIKKDVVDELYWDNRIDASNINVKVDNGIVKLSGEAPTYNSLTLARSLPWRIGGINDVKENIRVNYVLPAPLPSNEDVGIWIENTLAWDPVIDETRITVSVDNGIVTMEGTVDAYWKKSFVEDKISGIRGILDIENKLAVVPTERIDDEVIAQDIVAAFDRDVQVDPETITVDVKDGIATLSGVVPYPASRRAAERDASLTGGVIDVINELEVSP